MPARLATSLVVTAALGLGSALPAEAGRDRKPPTRPKNVRVVAKTYTSVTIAWSRSRDNVRVAGYGVYRHGKRVARTKATRYTYSKLEPSTTYTLSVDAYDTSRNRSSRASITVKTKPFHAPPKNRKLPQVSGTAQKDLTLTTSDGTWFGSPTAYAYQWLRCDAAGRSCMALPGASQKTYVALLSDVGSTLRARVMATNEFGSTSASSAQTAVVTATAPPPPPTPEGFPASFFTGPLGMANILPGKTTGALLGAFGHGTWEQQKNQLMSRESFVGRRFDLYAIHYGAPNDTCDYGGTVAPYTGGRETWAMSRGAVPVISWTHGWTIDSVNAGRADACLRTVARRAAAFGHRHLLRIYWEFNGNWMRWSGSGQTFIDAWRRTVRIFREEGARNVGFVWSPDGGYRDRAFASYPGDEWVDWAGMSLYNMNRAGVWCGATNPGPWCEMGYVLSYDPVKYPTIYDRYATRKPFLIGENGSVEDPLTAGRKGQWFRNARSEIVNRVRNVRGITYFDMDLTTTEGFNWKLDTSQSSLEGFRTLALDPFFNTRS